MEEYFELSQKLNVPFNYSILTVDVNKLAVKDYLLGDEEFKLMSQHLESQKNIVVQDTSINDIPLRCTNRCGAGRDLISIGADGIVYPCHMLHRDELKLGNVLKQDLKETILNENNPFLNISVDRIEKCKECTYKYFCGGNCRARSYLCTHDIYKSDDLCEVAYSHVKSKFEYLKKVYNL